MLVFSLFGFEDSLPVRRSSRRALWMTIFIFINSLEKDCFVASLLAPKGSLWGNDSMLIESELRCFFDVRLKIIQYRLPSFSLQFNGIFILRIECFDQRCCFSVRRKENFYSASVFHRVRN